MFSFSKESLSVVGKAENLTIKVTKVGKNTILTSVDLKVVLNSATGKISFYKTDGTPLFAEKDNGVSFNTTKDIDQSMYSVRQEFELEQNESIYGLGQFQDGKILGFIPEVNFSFILPLICLAIVSLCGYSSFKTSK